MSSPALEAFLARLYTDEALLAAFLKAPDATASAAGLDSEAAAAVTAIERDGLVMAARSFRAKRAKQPPPAAPGRLARWWRAAKRCAGVAPRY